MCLLEAPDLFGWDRSARTVTVRIAHPPDTLRDAARSAVVHCPAMALSVIPSVEED